MKIEGFEITHHHAEPRTLAGWMWDNGPVALREATDAQLAGYLATYKHADPAVRAAMDEASRRLSPETANG